MSGGRSFLVSWLAASWLPATTTTGMLRVAERRHLLDEVEAGAVVLPVAVVEVAGEEDEGDPLVDGEPHEVFEKARRVAPRTAATGADS